MFYVPSKPVNSDVAHSLQILPAGTLLQPSQTGQCYDHFLIDLNPRFGPEKKGVWQDDRKLDKWENRYHSNLKKREKKQP